ncbi:MAG: T9SS type A sorting domain-containing protein, partial [Chitinophagaceae bacterium]
TWSLQSSPSGGASAIAQANNPATSVTINKAGDYIFRWTIANGTCTNSDDVKISAASTLPVKSIYFKGEYIDGSVRLDWATSSEFQNDHFDIERSMDGISFKPVSRVIGSGSSQTKITYSWVDPDNFAGSADIYYRMKQYDRDGNSTLSNTIKITLTPTLKMKVGPNPFVDHTVIEFYYNRITQATILLTDMNGKAIKTISANVNKGINTILIDGMEKLPSAAYFLEVTIDRQSTRYKLVRNR